jgi:hypothetical protein
MTLNVLRFGGMSGLFPNAFASSQIRNFGGTGDFTKSPDLPRLSSPQLGLWALILRVFG